MKTDLATSVASVDAYAEAKEPWFEAADARARAWAERTGWEPVGGGFSVGRFWGTYARWGLASALAHSAPVQRRGGGGGGPVAEVGAPVSRSATVAAPSSRTVSRKSSRSSSRVRWLLIATRTATWPSRTVSVTTATPLSCTRRTSSWLTSSRRSCGTSSGRSAGRRCRSRPARGARGRGARRPGGQGVGLGDVAVDDPPEGVGAVRLERHPHPEGAEPPGQRDAVLVEPHLTGGEPAGGMGEEHRHHREGPAVSAFVAHEGEPDVDRRLHPLVEVERERVGAVEPAHGIRVPAQREEPADRTVDVEPQSLALGEVGDGRRGRRPLRC